jgi:dolichol kinase
MLAIYTCKLRFGDRNLVKRKTMFTLAKLRFVEFWRSNGVHSQLFGALLIGWGSLIASPFFDNRFFHISCALLFALAQRTCDRAASVCGARSGNRLLQRGISLTGPGRPLRLLR